KSFALCSVIFYTLHMINLNKNSRRQSLMMELSKWGFLSLVLMMTISGCKPKTIVLKSPPGFNFQVYQSKKLDLKLREISGIVWDKKRDIFIAEEDEGGNVYILDKSEALMNTFPFEANGDYEDIALVDTTAYILRSDGTIFKCLVNLNKGV